MSLVLNEEKGRGMCDFYNVITNYEFKSISKKKLREVKGHLYTFKG